MLPNGRSEDGAADESYNQDLAWILEKFCGRARAECGLILRLDRPEGDERLLAMYPPGTPPAPALLAALKAATLGAPAPPPSDTPVQELQSEGSTVLFLPFLLDAGTAIVVAISRTRGPFGLVQRRVTRRVHGVLERYLRLWWMHRCERRRAAALLRAVDLCDLGVVLVDRRGRLVLANPFARALLERQDGITLVAGTLAALHADEALRLQAVIHHAILQNARAASVTTGDGAAAPMVTLRREGKRALIATTTSFEQPALDEGDIAAVVYLVDPDLDVARRLAPACRHYALSASEARLVECLVAGATLSESAERLRVQPETARGYLKQVFAKTGTNRQADLLKLMISSASRVGVGAANVPP